VGATEVNETQKWAMSKKRLRTTAIDNKAIVSKTALRVHLLADVSYYIIGKLLRADFKIL
jgi:hypothetical protein